MLRDNSVFSRSINGIIERWTHKGKTPENVNIHYAPVQTTNYSTTDSHDVTNTTTIHNHGNGVSDETELADEATKQPEAEM